MDFKKILAVVGFTIFVLAVGFALYWVFFRGETPETQPANFVAGNIPGIGLGNIVFVNQNTNQSTNAIPWQDYIEDQISPVASGGLTAVNEVTDTQVSALTVTSNGPQYYDADKQKFYRINENGQPEEMSGKQFFQVDTVTWDRSGDKAILEYPDGSNILYNFDTGQQVTLDRELEDFSFNPSGNQIVAKWIGNYDDDNWLVGANDDGSGMFLIEPLGDQSYSTTMDYSPDNQIAAIHRKAYDIDRQEVFPIGLHGENFKSFVVDGSGFESRWSPEGNTLLYSVHSQDTEYTPNLWVTKGSTNELGDVKVSLNVSTWPEKCTFSDENTLFCAVPQGLPRGAGLFPEIADRYPDNFYHIDLNTGAKTLLASPVGDQGGYNAYGLSVSPDGSMLYFMDRGSGTLQSIRLK